MRWFSRSQPDSQSGRRTASRGNHATEAQVAELRGKARRRLIGALVLVLTAVIFVPMLFDSGPPDESLPVPVVVPSMPTPDNQLAQVATLGGVSQQPASPATGTLAEPSSSQGLSGSPEQAGQAVSSSTANLVTASTPADPSGTSVSPTPVQETPKPAAKPEPAPAPAKINERTDDGSVAIALLEGRAPKSVPSEKGNFILQIAAYGTEKDAQLRRERLLSSGVTNAYVEQAVSGGKSTYRLRVGPFPTRDAAQAAQARLRALGYDNGFISTQ